VAGADACAALALSPGCGMTLVPLASGLLCGGAWFPLSLFLGGAVLAGVWLAVMVTVSVGVGVAAGALAVRPTGRRR
jgi:hypothetical protein